MNSCLQCLNNIPELAKYFLANEHLKELNTTSTTKGNLASTFGKLVSTLWDGHAYSSTRPVEIKRVVSKFASRFIGYDQQDAQEFLRFFLDGLHEDLNRIVDKPKYYEIKDRPGATDRSVSDEYWKYYQDRNASAISDLFCGQLQSEVICQKCQHRSICYDVFWDLSVPIPKRAKTFRKTVFSKDTIGASCTLEQCLKAYTETETMRGDDEYYCSKCKTHRPVTKRISLYRAPEVLVIHLKRFSFSTFSREKVNSQVVFPTHGLNLDDFLAESAPADQGAVYELTGIVNHMGSLNGGHYTADCLNEADSWFNYNDASVSATDTSKLDGSSAYILFFRKQ